MGPPNGGAQKLHRTMASSANRSANRSMEKSGYDFVNEAKDFQAIIGNLKDLLNKGSNKNTSRQSQGASPYYRSVD